MEREFAKGVSPKTYQNAAWFGLECVEYRVMEHLHLDDDSGNASR